MPLDNEGYVKVPDENSGQTGRRVGNFFRGLNAAPQPQTGDGQPSRISKAVASFKDQNLGYVPTEEAAARPSFVSRVARKMRADSQAPEQPPQSDGPSLRQRIGELNRAPVPQEPQEPGVGSAVAGYGKDRVRKGMANVGAGFIDDTINAFTSAPARPEPKENQGPGLLARGLTGAARLVGRGVKAGASGLWGLATAPRPEKKKKAPKVRNNKETGIEVRPRIVVSGPKVPVDRRLESGHPAGQIPTPGKREEEIIEAEFREA